MIAADLMTRSPVCVGLDMPLKEVKLLFEKHGIRHTLVIEEGRLIGVLSERDLLKNISPYLYTHVYTTRDLASLQQRVHQVMTRHPITVFETDPIRRVVDLMSQGQMGCLPVISAEGRAVGLITRGDLIRRIHLVCEGLCGEKPQASH